MSDVPANPGKVIADKPAEGFKKYLPTKKWWAALVTGASGLVISVLESGAWDQTEDDVLKGLVLALVAAYIKGNDKTPGGLLKA